MAKSSFLALCQQTRRALKLPGTGPNSVTSQTGQLERIVEFVAEADRETQARWFDWDFLLVTTWSVNTVTGTAAVAAPADLGTWDEASFYLNYTLATNQHLPVLGYKNWRATDRQGVKVNAKPRGIVIKPDLSLVLEAPPDAIYSLSADYWKRPAKMVANGDTSPIPEEYEQAIVARAKMMYAEVHGASATLIASQVDYDDLMDKLESKYLPGLNRTRRMSEAAEIIVRVE